MGGRGQVRPWRGGGEEEEAGEEEEEEEEEEWEGSTTKRCWIEDGCGIGRDAMRKRAKMEKGGSPPLLL